MAEEKQTTRAQQPARTGILAHPALLVTECILLALLVWVFASSFTNGTRKVHFTDELPTVVAWRHYAFESADQLREDEILGVATTPAALVISPDDSVQIAYMGSRFEGTLTKTYTLADRTCYTVTPTSGGNWKATLWAPRHRTPGTPQGKWLFSITSPDGGWSYTDWAEFREGGTATFGYGLYDAETEEARLRDPNAQRDPNRNNAVEKFDYASTWQAFPTDDGLYITIANDGGAVDIDVVE